MSRGQNLCFSFCSNACREFESGIKPWYPIYEKIEGHSVVIADFICLHGEVRKNVAQEQPLMFNGRFGTGINLGRSESKLVNGESGLVIFRIAIIEVFERVQDIFLKILLMVLWETKSLDNKKYIALSEKLNEIGKMFGGWSGQLQKQNSPDNTGEK